jgi:hypothetical protein
MAVDAPTLLALAVATLDNTLESLQFVYTRYLVLVFLLSEVISV